MRLTVFVGLLLWSLLCPPISGAQTDLDASEGAQYRNGSLAFTPALVFSSGHDTNVYRTPKAFGDYETFAVPQMQAWWTQPGFQVQGIAAIETVHFANNADATNGQVGVRIDRLHSLFTPYFSYNRRRTNADVDGFEVGYKSLRLENDFLAGARVKISPRTDLRFSTRLTRTTWDADAIYQESSLREKLNRDTNRSEVGLGYALTPLTTIGGVVEVSRDRFRYSPIRDGNSVRLSSLVTFAKPAVVFGSASVGYEQFTSPASGAADYNGIIATVTVGYVAPDGTLFRIYVNRGPQYSYDTSLAYFILTGVNPTVSKRIGKSWDLAGFWGRYALDYRPAGTQASIGRLDVVTEYGGAIAYRVGPRMRLGWTVEHAQEDGLAQYQSLRIAAFMTYGSGRFQRLDRPTPFDR